MRQRQQDGAVHAAASSSNFPSLHGPALVRLRKERGMLQRDLARKLGVSQVLLSFVETGWAQFSPRVEARLVRALWPLDGDGAGARR